MAQIFTLSLKIINAGLLYKPFCNWGNDIFLRVYLHSYAMKGLLPQNSFAWVLRNFKGTGKRRLKRISIFSSICVWDLRCFFNKRWFHGFNWQWRSETTSRLLFHWKHDYENACVSNLPRVDGESSTLSEQITHSTVDLHLNEIRAFLSFAPQLEWKAILNGWKFIRV